MKINKVEISKFRSIENGEFNLTNLNAIVGQNNSGKSGIMRALNSFFNPNLELRFYDDGTNLYSTSYSVPRIIISFSSISQNSIYKHYLINDTVKIKQEYNKKRKKLDYFIFDVNKKYKVLSDEELKSLYKEIQFVLIPSERGLINNFENETGILRNLFDKFFLENYSQRDTLTPKVKKAFEYFKDKALKKVSKGIEGKYLAKRGFEITIDSKYPISYELFINDLAIKITEGDRDFKLEECGSGIQSMVAISVYKYLAELSHSNFIIGIEEPEINLHPQAQKELIYSLIEESNNNDIQIVFTTHSTVLIDQLEHSDIILIRKIDCVKRKFKSIIKQLSKTFWDDYNLDKLKYNKFHRFRNSDFFFANHILVTESPVDSEVIRNLLLKDKINIEKNGVSVLELGGITSLKYAFYLIKELALPKTFVIDKDFFLPYFEAKKSNSRDSNGFFKYKATFKSNKLISELLPVKPKRDLIEKYFHSNHTKSLQITPDFDLICMNYNLEMDLLSTSNGKNLTYDYLTINEENRNSNYLFENREERIKDLDVLLNIINNSEKRNLPYSMRYIIKRFENLK